MNWGGTGINGTTTYFLSGLPYWFGTNKPKNSFNFMNSLTNPILFSVVTTVANFTKFIIDFGDQTQTTVDIQGKFNKALLIIIFLISSMKMELLVSLILRHLFLFFKKYTFVTILIYFLYTDIFYSRF